TLRRQSPARVVLAAQDPLCEIAPPDQWQEIGIWGTKTMPLSADRTTRSPKKSTRGNPPWEIALLYPVQGEWTEEEFLALENNSENRMMELVDGVIEVLPMPDLYHQGLVQYLFRRVDDFARMTKKGE